jgi:hypothetical protein
VPVTAHICEIEQFYFSLLRVLESGFQVKFIFYFKEFSLRDSRGLINTFYPQLWTMKFFLSAVSHSSWQVATDLQCMNQNIHWRPMRSYHRCFISEKNIIRFSGNCHFWYISIFGGQGWSTRGGLNSPTWHFNIPDSLGPPLSKSLIIIVTS